jgi:uncharacterized membrane protein
MNQTLESKIIKWLRLLKIRVSSGYLKNQLQSHSDFPSLLSITDTLDELNIDNAALEVNQEKWKDIPTPFLIITRDMGGTFELVKNKSLYLNSNIDFFKRWTGLIILADKPDDWKHLENEKWLAKEKKSRQTVLTSILSVITISVLSLVNNFSWTLTGLLTTTLTGFSIAVLISQHELGINNELIEQLCNAGKHTDCDAVMHSKGSRLSKWMNWADVGIIYFASYSLVLITLLYTANTSSISILAILSCAAVPFTLFSLYYQWQVVKKWCPLCLLTIGVLLMQFLLLFPVSFSLATNTRPNFISFNTIFFTAFTFIALATAWLLIIKPALKTNIESKDKNFFLLRFKNDPDVFDAVLKRQRKVDTTPFENDLQLGNAYASVQILVGSNLYCTPCAKTHEVLHELINDNNIGLTIRLWHKADNKEDKRTEAGSYLLKLMDGKGPEYKKQVLHDWYVLMNLDKFQQKYTLQREANIQQQLEEHEQWNKEARIENTPTIFINGYELPKQYKATDLKHVIKRLEVSEIKIENNYALA